MDVIVSEELKSCIGFGDPAKDSRHRFYFDFNVNGTEEPKDIKFFLSKIE